MAPKVRPKVRPFRRLQVDISIQCTFPVSYRRLLGQTARRTLEGIPLRAWRAGIRQKPLLHLSIAIVSASAIQRLNKKYRNKNHPTDVLSFPTIGPGPLIGDLAICWSVAKKQTPSFGTSPSEEIQRLVVHGLLHLFGFDHERSRPEAKRMFALQEKVLRSLS